MPRTIRHTQTGFTSGEIDPALYGRVDMTRWQMGLYRGRNVRIRLQGGVRRRGGFRHKLELDDGTDAIRTPAFAFNTSQTYMIVLTAGKWRVLNRNGALVAEGSGAPWGASQVPTLNWAQSADTLLLFHQDVEPQRLRRGTIESSWTLASVPLENVPSFDYGAITPSGTITPSAVTGTITLEASTATFTADMVGWQFLGNGGRARITAYTDSTHVTAKVLNDFRAGSAATSANQTIPANAPKQGTRTQAQEQFASIDPITEWALEEPVISATRGWPACGTFFLGRTWMGGFRSRPSTLMCSKVGAYFDFDQGTALDDEAIYVTIDSAQINAIHQMVGGRTMQIFTAGAEFAETGGTIITPRTIELRGQSTWGSTPGVRTTDVEGATLFAPSGGASLRQFVYGDIEQAWASDLISLLSGHLVANPAHIESMVGGPGTDGNNVLITNADGTIALMTMARDQQIVAMTLWETQGEFRSTACLQSGDTFVAVERGGTMRIEQYDEDALLDASVLIESETPFDELENLFHLAGMEVGIILDGKWQGTGTVSAEGYLALGRMCNSAEVGLTFTPKAWTMPLEPRDAAGSMIGRKCRVVELALRVKGTTAFTVNGREVATRRLPAELDGPPPEYTEDITVRGLTGWSERHVVEIEQPIPGTFELLALQSLVQVGG